MHIFRIFWLRKFHFAKFITLLQFVSLYSNLYRPLYTLLNLFTFATARCHWCLFTFCKLNKQLTKRKQTSEYKWFLENHIIWMMKYGESETAGKNKQTDYLNIYKQPNITECSHFTFELDLFWIVCEVSLVLKRNLRLVFALLHKSMKGAKKSRG